MTIAPIYIMAAVTLLLSAALWGGLLYVISGRNKKLLWLLLPGLPLSAFANLAVKRPGNGISPMRWDEVLGTRAPRDFSPDEPIEL